VKLTDSACRNAKPKKKPYKIADGGGLYLLVKPDGAKYWRVKYYHLGKEKLLALGVYPLVTLAAARDNREGAKKLLAAGTDPMTAKKDGIRKAVRNASNTFEVVAREWHGNQLGGWSKDYADNILRRLEVDVFSHIGQRPIADIDAPELLEVLRKIEKRGALDLAKRIKQACGQAFRYGIATGRCTRDPAADLKNALKVAKGEHFASLDIKELPDFLKALERNDARLYQQTRHGIKLLMLTFVRTRELIDATWDEFDFENAVWEIPAARMKMRKAHIVPLSKQALVILKAQKELTGQWRWVFPNQVRPIKPMSNNTILFAIGRMGYKGKMTGHGCRALAMSTIKEKLGYRHEVVDRQLAHAHRNSVDAAYDRAKFLDDRKKMMQEWADYLDKVARAGEVIIGNFKTKA